MTRWFRHYAGMMRDEKLVRAAMRSGQPVERVVWVWGAILESAAEINDGGRFDLEPAEAAYFLRSSPDDIVAIVDALSSLERLAGGCVAKWGDRQFQSDSSAARQKRYRDGQKVHTDADGAGCDGEVTATDRHGDGQVTPPETETETEGLLTQSNGAGETVEAIAVEIWNANAERLGLPQAQLLTEPRRKALRLRLADLGGIEGWQAMIEIIGKSPHLLGQNDRGWKASLDWVLKPANLTKVMEGNYVRTQTNRPGTIAAGLDAIEEAIRQRGFAGVTGGEEDTFELPRLRQGSA